MADLSKIKSAAESPVSEAGDEETRVSYWSALDLERRKRLAQEDDIRTTARGKPRVRKMHMHTGYF